MPVPLITHLANNLAACSAINEFHLPTAARFNVVLTDTQEMVTMLHG